MQPQHYSVPSNTTLQGLRQSAMLTLEFGVTYRFCAVKQKLSKGNSDRGAIDSTHCDTYYLVRIWRWSSLQDKTVRTSLLASNRSRGTYSEDPADRTGRG